MTRKKTKQVEPEELLEFAVTDETENLDPAVVEKVLDAATQPKREFASIEDACKFLGI